MTRRELVSIVIPVFNEKESLGELTERVLAACRSLSRPFELILVDDGSRDGSAEMLKEAARVHPEVRAVILNRNYGQHAAVMAGFAESRGEIIITLDADLQNPPEEIPRLVAEMDKGFDVVGTVRQNRQDTLFRRLASSLVNSAVRRATGVMMHDYGCMLRAYRRAVIDTILDCTERSTFIPILANAFASNTAEIEVSHAARKAGESKYGLFDLMALQFDLLTSMSTFPLKVLSVIGGFISLLGIGFGVLLAVLRIIHGPEWAAEGVFTLFAILFVFVGLQFVGLGLTGEYIGRIYHDVRGRPRYCIKEIVGGVDDVAD